uniref:Uncharacterized protein n=1 Tax=Clytia hemisphaerica TaxID=252671 RepID=A0A7M5X1X1_9CNID
MNLLVVFVLFISYQCQAFDLPEPPEFANHPDTRISKWSGPYFNDEDQKRVFQSLLHGRSANEGRRRAASDTLGFDPNRLFNPTVERPHRRRKPEGPEAMTFEGNEAEAHPEDGVSPEEKLAHLVSKPIMEYAKDESENRGESRNYPGEPSEERRHRDEGYGERRSEGGEGDDNERRERFEGNEGDRTDAEHFMEEKRRPENFREEEGRRRSERNYRIGAPGRKNLMMKDERQSFFPGLEHGHFYPSKNERFSELYSRSRHQRGENNRKLIEQIRQYIKRSDLPKPYLNKRSKLMKSHSNTIRRSHVRKRSHIKSKGKKSLITGKHQRSHVSKPRLIKLSAKRSKVEKEHNKNKPTKRHSAKRSSVKESALKKRNSTAVHRDEITNHEENQSEVPGQESSNFGNQFSESYRNKDSNNGNNGYSDGEYFGSDSPDTGDDSVAEAMHGANDDTEQLIKSFANDKQFVKSLNGDFTSDGGKDVLLDSERIEGFDSHLLGGEGRHRQGATRQAVHVPVTPPAPLETHREPSPSQAPDVVDTQSLANQIMHDTADFTEFNREQATKNLLGLYGNKQRNNDLGLPIQDADNIHTGAHNVGSLSNGIENGGVLFTGAPGHNEMTPLQYGQHLDNVMHQFLPQEEKGKLQNPEKDHLVIETAPHTKVAADAVSRQPKLEGKKLNETAKAVSRHQTVKNLSETPKAREETPKSKKGTSNIHEENSEAPGSGNESSEEEETSGSGASEEKTNEKKKKENTKLKKRRGKALKAATRSFSVNKEFKNIHEEIAYMQKELNDLKEKNGKKKSSTSRRTKKSKKHKKVKDESDSDDEVVNNEDNKTSTSKKSHNPNNGANKVMDPYASVGFVPPNNK